MSRFGLVDWWEPVQDGPEPSNIWIINLYENMGWVKIIPCNCVCLKVDELVVLIFMDRVNRGFSAPCCADVLQIICVFFLVQNLAI